jgi:hypothetical protein
MKFDLKTIRDRCEEEGDCWIWQQCVNSGGYPQASINGKQGQMVRRHAVLLSGRTLSGYRARVADTCGNRLCCNPDHLRLRTFSQIQSDSYKSGARCTEAEYLSRVLRIQQSGKTKLSFAGAREIRQELVQGKTIEQISRERGVGVGAVSDIKHNRTWKEPMFAWAKEAA